MRQTEAADFCGFVVPCDDGVRARVFVCSLVAVAICHTGRDWTAYVVVDAVRLSRGGCRLERRSAINVRGSTRLNQNTTAVSAEISSEPTTDTERPTEP